MHNEFHCRAHYEESKVQSGRFPKYAKDVRTTYEELRR